jgi:hypothetical protein
MVKRVKIIKVKGPTQRLISPAEFAKALGAEETNIEINTKQDPMSLFILRQGLMNNESVRLAVDITERLFSEAPLHLKRPQAVELSKLTLGQLQVIARIKRFPVPKRTRDKIVSELESEELVTRMEKRWRLASAVISAERKGLYEAAEHATGMLDLSDDVEK